MAFYDLPAMTSTKPIHDALDSLIEGREKQLFRIKPHEYLCEYNKAAGRCFTHQSYKIDNITKPYYVDDSHLSKYGHDLMMDDIFELI